MDQFFEEELQREMWWFEDVPESQSAFVGYTDRPIEGFGAEMSGTGLNLRNMNKRMIELLRRRWMTARIETREPVRERCYRHMINERLRREKQRRSYFGLHSMLPPGTKNDKKSIIQMAAVKIEELQSYKEELERRNQELEASLAVKEGVARIRLRVANPSSGIDSMVEVLRCLKNLGLETRTIQSNFSALEFSAVLEIQTEIEAADIEEAVQRTLLEVERKLLLNFPEG